MADVKINANHDITKMGIENLNSAGGKLSLAKGIVESNPFPGLVSEPDLLSKYISEFSESITEVFDFSKKISTALEEYIPEPIPEPTTPVPEPTGEPTGPGGNSPSPDPLPNLPIVNPPIGNGPGGVQDPLPDPNITEPVITEVVDPTLTEEELRLEAEKKADLINTKKLEDLELKELDDIIGGLKDLADKKKQKLDEFAHDLENADIIKKYLLESKHIPQEFKDLIKDADAQTVRALLEQILRGDRPEIFSLNNVNLGVIYKYLLEIAQKNGISVEELLSEPKHSKLLTETLGQFEHVVELFKGLEDATPTEFQSHLLKLYDGDVEADKVKQTSVGIVRSLVDFISEETGIYYEELLTDTSYAETIKKGVMDFAKSALFVSTCSNYTDNGMRTTMSNLFNGNNLKVFGMSENSVKSFQSEIDSVAQNKGVPSSKLLGDKQYAEDVKVALQDSKTAKGVGSIFKDAKAEVSQEVASKIYNTSFESKKEMA